METLHLSAEKQGDIEKAAQILRQGGLVGIPTETVYGLAADALNGPAVAGIFAAKNRPMDNPLIVHISDLSQWEDLVDGVPENARALAAAYWPGPMTIILPKSEKIPDEVSAGLPTVGVRFPSHPVARAIIRESGCPLAAPSGNLSGRPSPTTAACMAEDMDGRIDAIVDGGPCCVGVESTVVTLATCPPRLLRPGGITLEQLKAVLGEVVVDPAVTQPLEEGKEAASPGMKYKHYAPKAHVMIVKGTLADYCRFVNSHNRPGTAALCFAGEEKLLEVPCVTYGSETDAAKQAHDLFDALRRLDEIGAKTVYARSPGQEGVGLAVYNRLIRAAGFEVLEV